MEPKLKSKILKISIGIIPAIAIVILTNVIPNASFKSFFENVIFGLCITIFINTFQLLRDIDKNRKKTENFISNGIDELCVKVSISKYSDKPWLTKLLTEIIDMVNYTKQDKHIYNKIEKTLNKAIAESSKFSKLPFREECKNELKRIQLLNDAIEHSDKHIYALTIDVRDYLDIFWQTLNSMYSIRNVNAAQHHVLIERIFIVDDDILINKSGTDKARRFWKIISNLKKGGPNMKLYVLSMSEFTRQKIEKDTSIFLCDEIICSESDTGNKKYDGYYYINETDVYDNLLTRFMSIRNIAKPINV